MNLTWHIEDSDVEKVRTFYVQWSEDPLVKNRRQRNIDGPRPRIDKDIFWRALVGCLLTTQQKAGPGSAVKRFLDCQPFPLTFRACAKRNLEAFTLKTLRATGGIRRSPTIAKQLSINFKLLEDDNLWQSILARAHQLNCSNDPVLERELAHLLANRFAGIGPKQSRNLIQWLGISKFEIPIDSRITKWLNRTILSFHLSANLLADSTYYDMVSDGIQALCRSADLSPCLFDAAVFASFDGGWSASDVEGAESLVPF